jgi:hypothetical protein
MKVMKCPMCGRDKVGCTPGGYVKTHLTPGGRKCIAIGLNWISATSLARLGVRNAGKR